MQDINQLCGGIVAMLYTLPQECIYWDFIKNVYTSIKDIHFYNDYTVKILVAAINNSIKYAYINNLDVGCPGNYAKCIVSYLGMPSFMSIETLNSFIFTEFYAFTECKCNTIYCEFKFLRPSYNI
jgi:hypothetical protein